MKYTHVEQARAMEKAAKILGLDAHIVGIDYKKDAYTWADRIMVGRFFRKGMPVKRSYLFCESLDVTFFFLEDKAVFTYAGFADQRDLKADALPKAFELAKRMVEEMEKAVEEIAHERG